MTSLWILVLLVSVCSNKTGAVSLKLQRQDKAFGQFGKVCSSLAPCDREANLACKHGVCECSMPEIMIYDPDISMCVVKAGEKCRYMVEMDEMDRNLHNAKQVVMGCVGNASCHLTDGTCHCALGFYSDTRGHCWEQKLMGQYCLYDEECNYDHGLECWHGACGCNPNKSRVPQIYASRHICVGIPGSPCVHFECELNSNCVDGTCVCPDDFVWSQTERRCKAGFDKSCVDQSFCHEGLDCINFRCKCKMFNQVYDMSRDRCLSIVSEPCERDSECVPNAFCSENRLCQCRPGYMEFGPGFCRNGYGSPCMHRKREEFYYVEQDSLLGSTYSDFENYVEMPIIRPKEPNKQRQDELLVIKVSTNTCDSQRKLSCINNKCECKRQEEMFDEALGRCVGLVGNLCKMYEHHACTKDSECIAFINLNKFGLGRCTCKTGFHVIGNRTCVEDNVLA